MRRVETVTITELEPGMCECGHSELMHVSVTFSDGGARTACSIVDLVATCNCPEYRKVSAADMRLWRVERKLDRILAFLEFGSAAIRGEPR